MHARAGTLWGRLRSWLTQARPAWSVPDSATAAALSVAVLLRWPDRARSILSWDGATFALATERYDVNALRPHAPGYPLFVLLAKLLRLAVPRAEDALALLSLLFAALAVALAYALGRAVADRACALALAVLLAASPVVYVHSVTANVYTADLAFSIAVALACWRCRLAPSPRRALVVAVVLALALGVRPSQGFFLAPLAAWAVLRPPWAWPVQRARLLPAAAASLLIVLAWFLPMARLSGGLSAWRRANALQGSQIVFADTVAQRGWPIVADNLRRLQGFAQWELRWVALPAAVLLLVCALAAWPGWRRPSARPRSEHLGFLAAWAVPPLLFYAFIFSGWGNGPSGYLLVLLPALLLAVILAVRAALRTAGRHRPSAAWPALGAAALLVSGAGLAVHRHDVDDVAYHDHDRWAAGWAGLGMAYPPENTSIVALWNFAYAWWAFPEYTVYNYRAPGQGPGEAPDFLMVQVARDHEAVPDWYSAVAAGPTDERHPLPAGTRHLVLFDFQLAGENGGPRRLRLDVPYREDILPNGWRVLVVDAMAGRPDLEDYFAVDPGAV